MGFGVAKKVGTYTIVFFMKSFVGIANLVGCKLFYSGDSINRKGIGITLDQWFPTCGTRTPGGTSETCRGYSRRKCVMAEL
jgi:hypothetical protein